MITSRVFEEVLRGCFRNEGIPERIVVALSGGVDSLCLTYLLGQFKKLYKPGMQITAVTIDHRYRTNSSQEALEVGEVVRHWGVDHVVKMLTYEGRDIGKITNFEEVAREKRYEIFEQTCRELGARSLFVAHNLNDQIETFLQRLQQNSSIFGLVGLRQVGPLPTSPRRPFGNDGSVQVIRPLISFEKSDIIDTCTKNDILWFEDHTNSNIHLTKRNLLRHLITEIIPSKINNQTLLSDERTSVLLVSKESLVRTHEEVLAVVSVMQSEIANIANYLKRRGFFNFDKKNLLLQLTLPFDVLDSYNPAVLSRLFYQNIYPISSVKHFHWSYAKLERHAVPKIILFYEKNKVSGSRKSMRITYLNVLFDIKLDHDNRQMDLSLTRQPLIHDEFAQVCLARTLNNNWSEWLLFDRRYWLNLRLCHSDIVVSIIPYRHDDKACREQLYSAFKNSNNLPILTRRLEGIPLIFAYNDNKLFAALPTYNIVSKEDVIDVEWRLKNNLYSL